MKRRSFIKRTTAATIPVVLGGMKVAALNNPLFNALNVDDDKVLVLIQLGGGNDGLNMILPKDQYSNLAEVRPNIIIPESSILDLTDTVGLHPVMEDLQTVYDAGQLNIVQSVGYPDQNRSHFRSMDIWQTGSSADEVRTTGWLGRYFDLLAPGYPPGYPNDTFTDPFAVTIGSSVNETCEGEGGNFSLALVDPDNLSALATPVNASLSPDSCYGDKMDFLVTSIIQTNAYNEVIEVASNNGNNLSTKYGDDNNLANSLKLVARLISGGLKTKVYVVNLGGFDTHAEQVVDGDVTTGVHPRLLQTLSGAICAFQDDLNQMGLDDRVVGMTFSEFGRRIRSNGAFGTDHGTAAPMMLFGSCVNPGIMGDNPVISPDVDQNEGVPMQFDFRSVYGSILMDWFDMEEQVVKDLLYSDFQYVSVLRECTAISTEEVAKVASVSMQVFPNPFKESVMVAFSVPNTWVKISLFDTIGNELRILTNQQYTAGSHQVEMEGRGLAAGAYYYHLQTDYGRKVERVVLVK
jgi:uncharacterized protein (DUF1501 family)